MLHWDELNDTNFFYLEIENIKSALETPSLKKFLSYKNIFKLRSDEIFPKRILKKKSIEVHFEVSQMIMRIAQAPSSIH